MGQVGGGQPADRLFWRDFPRGLPIVQRIVGRIMDLHSRAGLVSIHSSFGGPASSEGLEI